MSFLHRRCNEIDQFLKARIDDLEQENSSLRSQIVTIMENGAKRERELLDRVLAIANPGAYRAIVSSESTAPMPSVQRPDVRRAARVLMPGGGGPRPIAGRGGAVPILTPEHVAAAKEATERRRERARDFNGPRGTPGTTEAAMREALDESEGLPSAEGVGGLYEEPSS